jgi:hypothetical protein
MNEEDLLNEIFNDKWRAKSGREYNVVWCELCDCAIISCKTCSGSTCNAHCCDKCSDDFDEFNRYQTSILYYINDEEKKTYEKCLRIKHFIRETIIEGKKEINFKELQKNRRLSWNDEVIFSKELL